ncbi:MAG TPA: chorismate mutase [Gemmatimonadaceae bacterium]|jgi:chorismate mutase
MTERTDVSLSEALARCRDEIERIDDQIVALLERRMAFGQRTGELKREAQLPILDPDREAAVLQRVAALARQSGLPVESVEAIFREMVGMSRRAQEMK